MRLTNKYNLLSFYTSYIYCDLLSGGSLCWVPPFLFSFFNLQKLVCMAKKNVSVYIASSWRNAAGVELLTAELRRAGCLVASWVENNYGEDHNHVTQKMDFESWVNSPESNQSFFFDTQSVMDADIFIWYGPAGMDAAAELGIAWREANLFERESRLEIVGLWAKGENLGLMRKLISTWFSRPGELIEYIIEYKNSLI